MNDEILHNGYCPRASPRFELAGSTGGLRNGIMSNTSQRKTWFERKKEREKKRISLSSFLQKINI